MNKVGIIGGGPSGMMAGISASKNNEVHILEKNEKLGKKLYITGKGRCNLTNGMDINDFFSNIIRNPKFLFSSLYNFTNYDLMYFFEKEGLKLKEERGGRVFPESDKSSDVIKTLTERLVYDGVNIHLNTEVLDISKEKDTFYVKTKDEVFTFDKLIIASGGISYPNTGSTGDGYVFAKKFGHKIHKPYPSLVAFILEDDFTSELMGNSLKNVELTMKIGKKKYSEFGEMLFTNRGISGPIVLSLSSRVLDNKDIKLSLDFKPSLTYKKLDNRLIREIEQNSNKEIKTVLENLLIKRFVKIFLDSLNIEEDKKANQITSEERQSMVERIKNFPLHFKELAGFNQRIITAGGVDTNEINPSSLESKLVSGLYFCGEVINVDALTGGFNLQITFSTGYLAGQNVGD